MINFFLWQSKRINPRYLNNSFFSLNNNFEENWNQKVVRVSVSADSYDIRHEGKSIFLQDTNENAP
jgi:hypothetical protein